MQSAAFSANRLKYLQITGLTQAAKRPWWVADIVVFARLVDNQNRGCRDPEKACSGRVVPSLLYRRSGHFRPPDRCVVAAVAPEPEAPVLGQKRKRVTVAKLPRCPDRPVRVGKGRASQKYKVDLAVCDHLVCQNRQTQVPADTDGYVYLAPQS